MGNGVRGMEGFKDNMKAAGGSFSEFNLNEFGNEASMESIVDSAVALPLMSERKCVAIADYNIEDKKPVGYIIAFSFGKGAVEEVARLKLKEEIIIELVTVEKIVPIAKKPTLKVEITELGKDEKGVREIQFVAFGESEAGIEFYSWNFNYNSEKGFKADVMIDKEGKQTAKFWTFLPIKSYVL